MRRPLRSLRVRLLASHGGLYAVFLLAAFGLLDLTLRRAVVARVDRQAAADAGRILDLAARRKARILQAEFDRTARTAGGDAAFYRLSGPDGAELAASGPPAWHENLPERPPPGTVLRATTAVGGIRVRWTCISDAAGTTVYVGRSLSDVDRLVQRARVALLGGLGVSLAAGLMLAGRIVGRALERVESVRRAAADIASGDLACRALPTGPGDEIDALARTFNRMLDRIDTLMRELRAVTDDIAHELRTPITRIRGEMEAILTESGGEPARAAAAAVVEDCDGLSRTIDVMLRIARLESGREPAEQVSVDIPAWIRAAAEAYEPVAQDLGIRLEVFLPPPGTRTMGDRSGLQRALANLLDNALKYTASGGRIQLKGHVEGGWVTLAVADTGVGIAAADIPRIFDRFFRAAGTAPGTAGAGLGLCLARAIVHAHGGSLTVDSTPGAGSVFTIRLASAG